MRVWRSTTPNGSSLVKLRSKAMRVIPSTRRPWWQRSSSSGKFGESHNLRKKIYPIFKERGHDVAEGVLGVCRMHSKMVDGFVHEKYKSARGDDDGHSEGEGSIPMNRKEDGTRPYLDIDRQVLL